MRNNLTIAALVSKDTDMVENFVGTNVRKAHFNKLN